MEQFSAGDDTAWQRITSRIEESDAFILILGGRCGSIEPSSGKSYVHREYEYAAEKKKPYFALVISEAHHEERVKQDGLKVDERTHPERYAEFKKLVTQKLCAHWTDKKDIKAAIFQKLPEWAQREDLVGWIRADEAATPEVTNELARLSQENRELRSNATDSVTYGGLGYADLCRLLEGREIKIMQMRELVDALRLSQDPDVKNLLDLFSLASNAIAKGIRFGAALGDTANEGLLQLEGFGLLSRSDKGVFQITDDGRAFRNRLLHLALPSK